MAKESTEPVHESEPKSEADSGPKAEPELLPEPNPKSKHESEPEPALLPHFIIYDS